MRFALCDTNVIVDDIVRRINGVLCVYEAWNRINSLKVKSRAHTIYVYMCNMNIATICCCGIHRMSWVRVSHVMFDVEHFICGYLCNSQQQHMLCVYLFTVVVVVSHDLFNRISDFVCRHSSIMKVFPSVIHVSWKHAQTRAKGHQNSCWCKSFG